MAPHCKICCPKGKKKKKDPHITWGRRKETARMVNLTVESKGNLFAGDVTSNVNQNLVT